MFARLLIQFQYCSSNSKSEFSSIFDESDENRSERHFVAISQKFDSLMDFFLSWSCFPTSKVKYDGEKPGANPTKLLIYLLELIHACSWVNPFRKKNFIFNVNEITALVVNKRRRTYRSEPRLLWSFRLDDFLPDLLSYNLFFST